MVSFLQNNHNRHPIHWSLMRVRFGIILSCVSSVSDLCPALVIAYRCQIITWANDTPRQWHIQYIPRNMHTGFCFAVLCCGYTLTDFPISIRLTSLALWQSNDCPSASKATLMNMDKYFMWIYYERLHNHNKAKHNKTVCIFLGIYCICIIRPQCD